ncbi:MAG: hypothetical protein O7A08_00100 [SAR324 cluster bacterium]|nr:hypothetical protein [SAR324 cluster bacterium]MCZ6531344.1 hypothetical protein [SAR324 cluster bacterium]MCZ6557019.1 hypothetical protein [SAR324 cluster bacterium]MCZ6627708.1 hypothetical protein [SAR324 cluster bacterium]MCZ6729711.1 hypothetical protein [SAR324 cluster bacterium]
MKPDLELKITEADLDRMQAVLNEIKEKKSGQDSDESVNLQRSDA